MGTWSCAAGRQAHPGTGDVRAAPGFAFPKLAIASLVRVSCAFKSGIAGLKMHMT